MMLNGPLVYKLIWLIEQRVYDGQGNQLRRYPCFAFKHCNLNILYYLFRLYTRY